MGSAGVARAADGNARLKTSTSHGGVATRPIMPKDDLVAGPFTIARAGEEGKLGTPPSQLLQVSKLMSRMPSSPGSGASADNDFITGKIEMPLHRLAIIGVDILLSRGCSREQKTPRLIKLADFFYSPLPANWAPFARFFLTQLPA